MEGVRVGPGDPVVLEVVLDVGEDAGGAVLEAVREEPDGLAHALPLPLPAPARALVRGMEMGGCHESMLPDWRLEFGLITRQIRGNRADFKDTHKDGGQANFMPTASLRQGIHVSGSTTIETGHPCESHTSEPRPARYASAWVQGRGPCCSTEGWVRGQ